MELKAWQQQYKNVQEVLNTCQKVKRYAEQAQVATKETAEEIRLKKHGCIACGQPVPSIFFANHRFCEQCRETSNVDADYQGAFQRISQWMSDFYVLQGTPPISQFINTRNISAGRPIRMGGLKRNKIKCKGFMRRDVIEVNMIYAYVQLWMKEKWRGKQKCKNFRKIPYWYMAQYLYFYGKTDQAERMNLKWNLQEDVECLYFIERDKGDLRGELHNMLTEHPLR